MNEIRRFQLLNANANRLISQLLDAAGVPGETRLHYQQLLTAVLKMHEDRADPGDLKMVNAALKELRYAFKVFARHRGVPKVTVFGSARTPREEAAADAARVFGRRMVEAGWMVITGAGKGIMGAAQAGAGAERSFGLNIRLPFEQEANEWIAEDPKLITFKYFFTRKLFLVKEASALALFPGGYGTMDETFEALTLMQTGKTAIVPVVLVEAGSKPYWRILDRWTQGTLVERRLIDPADAALYRIVDGLEAAVSEILGFYRLYHSSRVVGQRLVLRLKRSLAVTDLAAIGRKFEDILTGPVNQAPGPLPEEGDEFPELPRLILPFTQTSYGRLRQLIDFINGLNGP